MNITKSPNYASDLRDQTQAIKAALCDRMPELCTALIADKPSRQGNEYRYGTHGSLAIEIAGHNAGQWFDHEAGEGGHAIDLIIRETSQGFKEARQWALEWLGGSVAELPQLKPREPQAAPDNPYKDNALRIWEKSGALTGTEGEAYLKHRAINILPSHEVARFNSRVHWKVRTPQDQPDKDGIATAIIMLVRNMVTGEPLGIQRRYLNGQARKHPEFTKAKSYGRTLGGAIMLTGHKAPQGLNVAEGFEDALSVQCLGIDGGAWALCGTSGIKNLMPLDHIQNIRIWADNDPEKWNKKTQRYERAGIARAMECVTRWREAGKGADWQTAPEGKDINAYLQMREAV